MKKINLFAALLCAALCAVLLLAGCKGKTAQESGSQAVAGGEQAAASKQALSAEAEKLAGTYWKAVEFINQDSPLSKLRIELFLWQDGTGRFLLKPIEGGSNGYDFDIMCEWTFKNGELKLDEARGVLLTPHSTGTLKDGRLTILRRSSSLPIVMEQAAMPKYGARWNDVFRLYTEELMNAQVYSNSNGFDPDSSYPPYLEGAQLADLNFDGTPELFIFGPRTDAPQEMHIFTVSGDGVKEVFEGLTDMGEITLYRKKIDGSLAYSFTSAGGDWITYEGTIYLASAKTRMDKTFADSAKIAEFTITQYLDDDGDLTDPVFTFNGREVNRDTFIRQRQDLFKDYIEVDFKPAMIERDWEWDWDEIDVREFLLSYWPEGN